MQGIEVAEVIKRGSRHFKRAITSSWTRIFKDPMTKLAAIDRVVHHSVTLDLMGMNSYRAQEAGDQKQRELATSSPTAMNNQMSE